MTRMVVPATGGNQLRLTLRRHETPLDRAPAEVEKWIDDAVTNLASAKRVIKVLALDVAALKALLRQHLEDGGV